MKFYRIQSGAYVFYAKVQMSNTDDPDDETITVSIGSKRTPMCLLILLDSQEATTGILQNVSYDERCTSNQPMPKKIGTRAMVQAALACIKALFPNVVYLTYTDESFFLCEGKKVATANMAFILNGKTWYETHFHAEPENKEAYETLKKLYIESNLHDVPFHRIWKQSLELTTIPKKAAHNLYKTTTSWRAFYQALYAAYHCVPFIHITVYKPFALFCPRLKTLVGETWRLPVQTGDNTTMTELKTDDFPEMEWKRLEIPRRRMFGGLNKTRRFQQMYLGGVMDGFD